MSDKVKKNTAPAAKNTKIKRPSTVSVASTSRSHSTLKLERTNSTSQKPRSNKNLSLLGDGELKKEKTEGGLIPEFNAEYRQIAYGKFLRAMLEDCLVDEKIEREETQIDVQMGELANRFKKTMDVLHNTNMRLKDISFVVEQKRLVDMKNSHCSQFYEITEKSNPQDLLKDLHNAEQANLDKLDLKNVDFGYNKDSGHKQLLDAVNDALQGLEEIKKHSNLDIEKFKEYEKAQLNLEELDKDRFDLDSLKTDFEAKFPKFSEKLLKEVSDRIASVMDD